MFSNWFLLHFQANSGTSAQGRWRSWLTLTHQTRIKKKNSDTVGDQQRGSEGLPLPSPPGRVYLPINIAVSQSNYTHKFLERYQDTWAKGNVCEQTCSLNCNRQNPETNHRPIEHSVCRQNQSATTGTDSCARSTRMGLKKILKKSASPWEHMLNCSIFVNFLEKRKTIQIGNRGGGGRGGGHWRAVTRFDVLGHLKHYQVFDRWMSSARNITLVSWKIKQ